MRILLPLLLFCGLGFAQNRSAVINVSSDPSGACSPAGRPADPLEYNITNGKLWGCNANVWTLITGAGLGGSVTTVSGVGPSWLTWTIANPTTTPAITLSATTGQSSHQVIGTCNALTAFAPCALVAADIPSLSYVSSVATGCGASGGTITATGTITGTGVCVTIANEAGTGTTANKLVELTGAPSTAIITGTGTTTGIVGVCDSGCGKTGSAVIQQNGLHITTVDGGGSTAGHWAQQSTTTAGDTQDSGVASTAPAPAGTIGIYLQTFGAFSTVVTDLTTRQ